LFAAALRRLGKPLGPELVIDARSAEYVGQYALSALSTHAQKLNVTAVLRVSRSQSAILATPFPALRIERALLALGPNFDAIPYLNFHRYWGNIRLAATWPAITSRGW
jgi:hypothetical protein